MRIRVGTLVRLRSRHEIGLATSPSFRPCRLGQFAGMPTGPEASTPILNRYKTELSNPNRFSHISSKYRLIDALRWQTNVRVLRGLHVLQNDSCPIDWGRIGGETQLSDGVGRTRARNDSQGSVEGQSADGKEARPQTGC